MAIQFLCPGCEQPIEVDDEHAGKIAACPYCQHVVTVPQSSTYRPEPVPDARPARLDSSPDRGAIRAPAPDAAERPPVPLPSEYPHAEAALTPRELAARKYGNYALLCAGLAAVLFACVMVALLGALLDKRESLPESQRLSTEKMTELQKEVMRDFQSKGWYRALNFGSQILAMIGLALSITSLSRHRKGNWRATVALVFCAAYVLCLCGGVVLELGGTLAAYPGIPG